MGMTNEEDARARVALDTIRAYRVGTNGAGPEQGAAAVKALKEAIGSYARRVRVAGRVGQTPRDSR